METPRHLFLYSFIKRFKDNWKDTDFWKSILLRFYFMLRRRYFLKKSKSIFSRNWDVLIILDACRYDTFKKIVKEKNYNCKLSPFYSLGTHTLEFIKKNFKTKHNDVIYISGNPFCEIAKEKVFKYIPVWKKFWNKKYNTVLPEDILKISKLVKKEYPNKKLIIHLMQPHHPFIHAKSINEMIKKLKVNNGILDPWHLAKKGYIKEKELWNAYEDNLRYVLPYAIKFANYIKREYKQKTVITADHGNAFEKVTHPFSYLIAGHPYGVYIKSLIEVPWCEIY